MPGSWNFASRLRRLWEGARHLWARPRSQKLLVVEAAWALGRVKWIVATRPFERWRAMLWLRPASDHPEGPARTQMAEVVWAVDRVSALLPRQLNCLPRALAVQRMFARRGWDSRLEIGMALEESGQVKAHAWVHRDGEILIGNVPDLDRYRALPLPSAPGVSRR